MNHLLTALLRTIFLPVFFFLFLLLENASSQTCNNWLNTPSQPSWVNIGDLDVSGTQLTVEALINIKGVPPGGVIQGLDVVSKHTGPTNVNYLLRSSHAELSTTNGYFYTPDGCDLEMNKTYHVAMVYNGVTLKYYRNGFLLGETPATGNMIQSNLPTGIGFISTLLQAENFIGFINEVRIWNVARSQNQIRTYMNGSIPNPTTQAGLLAYYTFDNLLNKQGNPAWNGTLVGSASINRTNPECLFIPDTCAVPSPCEKTLSIPTQGSKVVIGDVDVTGNKLTVEAMFNRTPPLNSGLYYGHLVSKHTDQTNVNYALLPNGCEITTNVSGYKAIFQDCPLELGKTYHAAMVYDGATLKFYRNGFLISQVACTGNVVTNNLLTTIGQIARGDDPFNNQFLGYTNEVRIWKVARTQAQIATYMNGSLPNPTTQVGLVAYHSFNDLDNKQGNAAFNGSINGGATVGKANPDCAFVPSSCNTVTEVAPGFIIPDTVCVNEPVNISNISMNTTSYYWNFCVADINQAPTGTNLGNIGGNLSLPVFTDIVYDNGNYYVFLSNYSPGGLVRLNFGNSLLNTPTADNFGNMGGIIPNQCEGIQVVKNEGKWYVIMVGGNPATGIPSRIVKVDFGSAITNPTPVATNWGNIGNLYHPMELHLFKEGGNWFGITVNSENNTITRLSFGNSFENLPTGQNLGNIGNLDHPGGINVINDKGYWRAFTTNATSNTITRLDFGTSMTNIPTGINLGNPGGALQDPRDLYIMKECDQTIAFVINGQPDAGFLKLDFNKDFSSIPAISNFGNLGNMNFPHSISQLFRAGNDLYCFVPNAGNNTITRVRFTGCISSSIPNSSLQNPPPITYNTPGTYNINLTIDEGLPTQSSICKQVVVKDCLKPIIPDFDIPDTVCVNTPVAITNKTTGATSHYWNFCVADINQAPTGTNLGNTGGLLSQPVFMDYVFYNGNYYGFVINHYPGKLVRLNFGNSLLNPPTATDLGNFGGIIPAGYGAEGIQIVQNEGKWYAIIVGGYTPSGSTPRVLKIDFGNNLLNATPVATNWGNIGNLLQPLDLHVFKENNNWYGLTINAENNTITRFNFTNSFDNTPTAINLGGFGMLDYPTGIYAINDNGFWRVFVTNNGSNSRLVRLDFGSSLLNTPIPVNLGSIGNSNGLRDLTIIKYCDQVAGFAVNGVTNSLYRLNFSSLTSVPVVTNLGNVGNLNFPHSISKLFRVNEDVYSFITNVTNNTITRLKFSGCTNASIASSSLQNPPPVIYNTPGTYNINLTIDDGLPTQSSVCKQVVVLPALEHKPIQAISICDGLSVKIGSSSITGTYLWNNGAVTDSISVNSTGVYWVETSRFGCTNRDSFSIIVDPPISVDLGIDKTICPGDNLILDAGIVDGSYAWSTGNTDQTISISTAGTYYVTVSKNSCTVTDTIKITDFDLQGFDFSYKQDVCNPLTVQFKSIGGLPAGSYWSFGDGNTVTGGADPVHTYATTGNYIVKYGFDNGTCTDTIQKTISINIIPDNLILTTDTTICYGSVKQLRTIPSLSFCWTPTTYLDNPASPNPITSATQDITYYFTAEVTGANLIINGDFSSGNSGFTSQYNFANTNTTEGQYFVGANPQSWNSSLSACKDHTTGNGNMMLVNGSPAADVNVWKQTVNVTPNTNYAFSTWIQALWPPNPAQLQFSINGKDAGSLITASLPTCTWTQFYTTWNSGNNTTAVISIVNKNTLVQGNDFALDDISFAPVFIKRDSVKIKVEKPIVQTNNDTSFCPENSVQLNTTGAQNYSWSPAAGLSATGIANPIASPAVSTEYIVTGTTINGCSAKDTVNVNIYAKPAIVVSADTTICKNALAQLSVTGGATYSWSPAATLNNDLISNPVASPVVNTMYYVAITDANTCEHLDSVQVSIRPDAVFSINNPEPVCRFDSAQLIATGGDIYTWQPAGGLNNTSISNPRVSPAVTTDYSVTITEATCNQSETLLTRVIVKPLPTVNAAKVNDIDCRSDRSQLNATGADQYVWTPAATLNDPGIYNPVATPASATPYVVTGTLNGCSAKDTVIVNVYTKPTIVVSKDTTICKNAQAQLFVTGGSSYSWSPSVTLSNHLIANPVASPVINTKYYVTIKDARTCEYLDSVEVSIKPDPVFSINGPGKVCLLDSVQLNASGGDIYSWQSAGGLANRTVSNPWVSPSVSTDYRVTITETTCNQSATLSTRLTVMPLPEVNAAKSNDIDCSNDRSQLNASGANQYVWTPAATLSNPGIHNPVATPVSPTEYIVKGTDLAGCKGYDTITVKVDNVNKGGYLMPNAFTPNNDGLNDCYGIKYWGIIDNVEFSIYNRWGERIFFAKNSGQCWDGTYKGVKQDGGVYVYMIKARTTCEPEVFRKGTFVLIR